MSRSPIQLDNKVKSDLEELRDSEFYCKTHSDAVHALMFHYNKQKETIKELKNEIQNGKERRQREDIYLGEELMGRFKELQDELMLSPGALVEFLLEVFGDPTQPVGRFAFDTYVKARASR